MLKESLLIFLIGVISDKIDGLLARRFHVEKNELGKVIDPVSDRIFLVLAFFLYTSLH